MVHAVAEMTELPSEASELSRGARVGLGATAPAPRADLPARVPSAHNWAESFVRSLRRVSASILLVAVGFSTLTYAEEPLGDPFGSHTVELHEGPLVAIWENLRDKVWEDKLRIEFCEEFKQEPCPSVFKLMNVVEEARKNEGKALLGHLNRSINLSIKPVPV
jgi:hypothetical protein